MSVLKDASATALYGSRAANGVIIITTKKGKSGDSNINVKANLGFTDRAIPEYDLVNSREYYQMMYEGVKNKYPGYSHTVYMGELLKQLGYYNQFNVSSNELINPETGKVPETAKKLWDENWSDELFRIGKRQEYVASASGGSEKANYYISAGYLNTEGIVIASDFERFNARINGEAHLTDWLTAGLNFSGSTTEQNAPNASGNSYTNGFMFTRNIAPIYPVRLYDDAGKQIYRDGKEVYDYGNELGRSRAYGNNINPVATQSLDKKQYKRDAVSSRGFLNFSIIEGLSLKVSASTDYYHDNNLNYQNRDYGDGQSVMGRSTRYSKRSMTFSANELITYDKTFNESHHVNILFGHENYSRNYNYMSAQRTGFPFMGFYELDAAAKGKGSNSYEDQFRMESYLSRINYDYNNKYYLSLSYRADGSSRFHKDKRWGSFWSIGGSWRMTAEPFLSDIDWLNNLSVKASFGSQGQDNLGTYYAYQGLYSLEYANNGLPGIWEYRRATPDLTWEKNNSLNMGFDARIFNKLTVEAEYYIRKSNDLLFSLPLAPSTGIDEIDSNIAEITNKGFDITLNANIIASDRVQWDLSANFTHYTNEITELPQGDIIQGTKKWSEGRSVYDFYLREFAGVDPETGKSMWYTDVKTTNEAGKTIIEKQKTTNYNYASKYYVGTSIPDLMGGITNTFKFGDFDAAVTLTYTIGGKVLDYSYMGLMHGGDKYGNNLHKDILDRWTEENQNTDIPVMDHDQNANGLSSRFLFDGDYLKVKNVTIGYTMPTTILERFNVKQARIYASGANLLTLTSLKGLDPSQSFSGINNNEYTPLRTITLGVNLKF
jgi:TonB-linked SusC/RagA family outer membrane protein